MANPLAHPFYLFGDLWLEDPRKYVGKFDASNMNTNMALIRSFDQSRKSAGSFTAPLEQARWTLESAFATFSESEIALWNKRGVEMSTRDLIPPSGSMESLVACHLLNPTYYVANPKARLLDDLTSPTMRLLNECGFSSNDTFFFDQICRRGRSEKIVEFYTDEFYQPHRDFVRELRQNMAAVVEICYGEDVWTEMKRELGSRLIRFSLWGMFESVRLYLEVDEDHQSLRRFILYVRHPQFFVRSGLQKLGPQARKDFGLSQDLALTAARRLAGYGQDFTLHYFQTCSPCRVGNQLTSEQREQCKENDRKFLDALNRVFPERYQEKQRRKGEKIQEMTGILHSFAGPIQPMSKLKLQREVPQDQLKIFEEGRAQMLANTILSFQKVYQDLVDKELLPLSGDLQASPSTTSEEYIWDDLPHQLIEWMQARGGLRLNGESIVNRDTLETAFQLLSWRKRDREVLLPLGTYSVASLAITVILQYLKDISSPGSKTRRNGTVPGSPGKVIQRKCSACKKPTLDDNFPRFQKDMPDIYVITEHERASCGRIDCPGRNVSLIPINPRQGYTRLRTRAFKQSPQAKNDKASINVLLRSGSDLENCLVEVRVRCSKKSCGHEKMYRGRWTIHDPPKLLLPHLSCQLCGHGTGYFSSVDPKIPTVTEAALYDVLRRFKAVGCDLMEYPKLPNIIFARKLDYRERFRLLQMAKSRV